MSIRELARIQGFPDTYQFYGTARDMIKIIGNAVPTPLGKVIGTAILAKNKM